MESFDLNVFMIFYFFNERQLKKSVLMIFLQKNYNE